MRADHEHRKRDDLPPSDQSGRGRRLIIALVLNLGITAAEVIGGLISGSLALLADAAHNFSDAGSILVSYIAWRIAMRPSDARMTFGYARAETVGAVINLTTLLVIAAWLLFEAAGRLFSPHEVASGTMLIVGVIALVEDLAAAWVLRKDTAGLNVRSTYLHMIADALATVAVIVGALAMMVWPVPWLDPLLTAALSVYIAWHAGHEIRKAIRVLMDAAPEGFDLDRVVSAVEAWPDVTAVHHVHVRRITEERVGLEMHVETTLASLDQATRLTADLKSMLRDRLGIDHATIQVESAKAVDHDRALIRNE